MSNITLALDENTYRTARIVAAERGTSVSAMVRDYLQSLRPDNSEANRKLLEETFNWAASTGNYSAQDRYTREEVNDRNALRREFEANRSDAAS
jgi:plasmid stability protein